MSVPLESVEGQRRGCGSRLKSGSRVSWYLGKWDGTKLRGTIHSDTPGGPPDRLVRAGPEAVALPSAGRPPVSIARRIIPISSGKGGVGKTTLALNYALALSQHGRTVLIDLDTGTSSVRNCIDTPVPHDLYHFFKKGHRLADCVTTLDARLDPAGHYQNFGFIASPQAT